MLNFLFFVTFFFYFRILNLINCMLIYDEHRKSEFANYEIYGAHFKYV